MPTAEQNFCPHFSNALHFLLVCFQTTFHSNRAAAVIAPTVRQSASLRHCKYERTTMTISPVALRRKTERKPHPTARYWKNAMSKPCSDFLLDLVYQAAEIHRQNFNPREIQLSTLLSIKTGGCPEDCAYCPQSAHHNTNLGKEQMMDVDEIVEKPKSPNRAVQAVSAWVRHGAAPNPKTWRRFPQSSKPSKDWAWKPAARSVCSKTAWRKTSKSRFGLLQPQPRHRP